MTRQNGRNDNQKSRQGIQALLGVRESRKNACCLHSYHCLEKFTLCHPKQVTDLSEPVSMPYIDVCCLYLHNLEAMNQPQLMPSDTEYGAHMDLWMKNEKMDDR